MTTIAQHLTILSSSAYCPCCGNSKPAQDDYCVDCSSIADTVILEADGGEPKPMYPYEVLPVYAVGYVSDVTTWTP